MKHLAWLLLLSLLLAFPAFADDDQEQLMIVECWLLIEPNDGKPI